MISIIKSKIRNFSNEKKDQILYTFTMMGPDDNNNKTVNISTYIRKY